MKENVVLTLILLLGVPMAYPAEHETKAQAAVVGSQEQIAANDALIQALLERNLAGVEKALQQGADIMAHMETLHPLAFTENERPMSILAYVGKDGYKDSFEHDVLVLFFKYNKLNKHNLNMIMLTNVIPDPYALSDETTPFLMCVMSEAVDLVKKCLEHGADVHKTVFGQTPLTLLADSAVIFNNKIITPEGEDAREQITKLLIQHGASIDTMDQEGYTALDFAILNNYVSMVKVLLQYRAKFDTVRGLIDAVKFRHSEVVELLLAYGVVNPNGTNDQYPSHMTPLMFACKNYIPGTKINLTIIEHLLAAGANPLLEDTDGHDAVWHLMQNAPSTPEQAQAIKLINAVIAKRMAEVEHDLFGEPGISTLAGEFLSGDFPKKSVPTPEPDEEE